MKRVTAITAAALLLCVCLGVGAAEQPSVDDLLACVPGENAEATDSVSAWFVYLGEAAITEAAAQLVPMGGGDDSKARYALSGVAKYVTRGGAEAERVKVSQAFCVALDAAKNPEVQAFLIRQLQVAGGCESVPTLSRYLSDDTLCEPATQALQAIGRKGATDALLAALPSASGANKVTIAKALGTLRCRDAVKPLLECADSDDAGLRGIALYALAEIGDKRAAGVLAEGVSGKEGICRSKGAALYLRFAERLAEEGKTRRCVRACKELLAQDYEAGEVHIPCAALSILVEAAGKRALPDLLDAMSSQNPVFRSRALALAAAIPGAAATAKWVDAAESAPPEARAEILGMLGARGDATAMPALVAALSDASEPVRDAAADAIGALATLDDIPVLVDALLDADTPESQGMLQRALVAAVHKPPHSEAGRALLDDALAEASPEGQPLLQAVLDTIDEIGFIPLFNGTDLTGWTGDTKGYVAENGKIVCQPGGNLYTENEFGDFILRFEFKLPPGGNNGLAIRAPIGGGAYNGMELQILDNTAEKYKDLHPYQYHGSIYGIVPAKRGYLKPVGEWNCEEVIAEGRQITVKLNGTVIVDANLDEVTKPTTMDGKEHKGLDLDKGHIGFLGHGDRLEFRNIRLREL